MKAYEVLTLFTFGNRKIIKKYIVISDEIPKNISDLGERKDEEFIEARLLNHEVIIK